MTIEERVEKLEQKLTHARLINRLLSVMGIVIFIVIWFFSSGIPIAQENGVYHEVHAKAFVLKDENGLNRAILTMSGDCPVLYMFDENGTSLIELSACKNTPYLGMFDENVKTIWSAP